MRFIKLFFCVTLAGLMGACTSPQDRAAKAQESSYKAHEEVAKERLELVDKYQQCVKRADDNRRKVEACDSYLRAAQALK